MTTIRSDTTIGRSPDDVFAYVTTSGNWPKWHPSSLGVSGATDHPMREGETCTETFVVAGRHGTCEWTVRECDPPRRWRIDTTTRGGYAAITYTLEGAAETRFTRLLEYRMPNVLLSFLNALVMRARIRRESDEATRRLRALLEESSEGR